MHTTRPRPVSQQHANSQSTVADKQPSFRARGDESHETAAGAGSTSPQCLLASLLVGIVLVCVQLSRLSTPHAEDPGDLTQSVAVHDDGWDSSGTAEIAGLQELVAHPPRSGFGPLMGSSTTEAAADGYSSTDGDSVLAEADSQTQRSNSDADDLELGIEARSRDESSGDAAKNTGKVETKLDQPRSTSTRTVEGVVSWCAPLHRKNARARKALFAEVATSSAVSNSLANVTAVLDAMLRASSVASCVTAAVFDCSRECAAGVGKPPRAAAGGSFIARTHNVMCACSTVSSFFARYPRACHLLWCNVAFFSWDPN